MNEKQRRFADEYLLDLNAVAAAKRAGYAAGYGSTLLKREPIQRYIEERLSQWRVHNEAASEDVVRELAIIAFASIADYMRVVNDGGEMRLEALPTEEIPPEKMRAVAQIKQGAKGVEIKLCDKMRALNLLGLHTGAFEVQEGGETCDGGLAEALGKAAQEAWEE